MTAPGGGYVRRVEPLADGWRHAGWPGGSFDAGGRTATPAVEGVIRTPRHVLLVTLSGGAGALEVESDCGHRYAGRDFAGAVSLAPADALRRLRMREVEASWASIALDPGLLDEGRAPSLAAFTNIEDPLIAAMVAEISRVHARDGAIDPLYGETMARALAQHLLRRQEPGRPPGRVWRIPPRRMRRLEAYIDARLDTPLRVAELAGVAGLSTGYFHRAFRLTTGLTPLAYVLGRRVRRAEALLKTPGATVAQVAMDVGFVSPSHFARTYRRWIGRSPSEDRRG